MDGWARDPNFKHVSFFCICVEDTLVSRRLTALSFIQDLRLEHTNIGYFVRDDEMPTFGQLGCQGFIVANPDGKVIVASSPPWLQYRANALYWMTNLFSSLGGDKKVVKEDKSGTMPLPKPETTETSGNKQCDDGGCNARDCSSSSCSKSACSEQKCCDDTCGKVSDVEFEVPDSVKVESMDKEHADLVAAMIHLSNVRHLESLEKVLELLECHFAHEEALLNEFGFGGKGAAGAMVVKSHTADHSAILELTRSELEAVKSEKRVVSLSFLKTLADRFSYHTREYDSRYADFLKNAGAV